MIQDNAISSFAKNSGIKMYEASVPSKTVKFHNENEYVEMMSSCGVKTIFYSLTETIEQDEDILDIDFEDIQRSLEIDFKFLPVISDMLSSDEYITRLDGIISKYLKKRESEDEYKESRLIYTFFADSIGYSFEYLQTEGSEDMILSRWDKVAQLKMDCQPDILEWGKEFAAAVLYEKTALEERLKTDARFMKCPSKDERAFYYDEMIDKHYPYLKAFMTHPNSFKRIPDFYISFDKKARAFYATRVYESATNP